MHEKGFLDDAPAVDDGQHGGQDDEQGAPDNLEVMDAVEDDPGEDAGGEVQRTAQESFRNLHCGVARPGEYVLRRLCEEGGEVGDEIQAHHQGDEADKEGLDDIALRVGEYHREEVEQARERGQRQEFVAGQDHGQEEDHGDQQQGDDQGGRMADHQGRTHADVEACGMLELPFHQALGRFCDGFQPFDEEGRDPGNQLHHRAHLDAQAEDLRDALHDLAPTAAGKSADQAADEDAQEERLAQDAEFLLHPFRVDVETVHAGNLVHRLAEHDGEGDESLAERLRDRDPVDILIEGLEILGRQVGHHERDDEADDGGEEAPPDAVRREVHHGADEGVMPVVPQVDVHGLGRAQEQQEDVDAQADRDDEGAHGGVVGDGRGRGPTHVEDAEVEVVDVRHRRQGSAQAAGQQGRHDGETDETDAHLQAAAEGFPGFDADADAEDREDDRHHDRGAQSDDIAEYFFHMSSDFRMLRLFADVGEDPAVHIEDLSVHGVGCLRGEEHRGPSQFIRIEPAARRRLRADECVERMPAAVRLLLAQGSGLLGGDVAGAQAVALDVVTAVFGTDIPGQHLEPALRRSVGRHRLAAQFGHHRADVDDLPFTALHHLGHHGGGSDVRSHQVDVDDLLELGACHLVHRDALDDAGVVHEDVDGADLGVDCLDQRGDSLLVGDIADEAADVLDAGLPVVFQPHLEVLLRTAVEDDVVRAGKGVRLADFETDAVCAACDPGIFPFQGKQIQVIHSVSFCFQIYNRLH